MKKIQFLLFVIAFITIGCGSSKEAISESNNSASKDSTVTVSENVYETVETVLDNTKINWLDFETAIDKNAKQKKFIFIDVYTDWCGWCKKMDASTFQKKSVIEYMNKYFYAVKMNAESREPIAYKGVLYEYKQYNQRSGYNTLAVSLLNSKMSFPSFVVLNKNEVKKGNIVGYKDATALLSLLKGYVGK